MSNITKTELALAELCVALTDWCNALAAMFRRETAGQPARIRAALAAPSWARGEREGRASRSGVVIPAKSGIVDPGAVIIDGGTIGIALYRVDATTTACAATIYIRDVEVQASALIWPIGISSEAKAAALAQLAGAGISIKNETRS